MSARWVNRGLDALTWLVLAVDARADLLAGRLLAADRRPALDRRV